MDEKEEPSKRNVQSRNIVGEQPFFSKVSANHGTHEDIETSKNISLNLALPRSSDKLNMLKKNNIFNKKLMKEVNVQYKDNFLFNLGQIDEKKYNDKH